MNELVLGWKLSPGGDPRYWLARDPKPGGQTPDTLVTVTPGAMGAHTAIVAQSGSGKSYFLGRLIEELLLKTKARCIILDSNADFRKISEVCGDNLWQAASYDTSTGEGKLPHESSRDEFLLPWKKISTEIVMRNPARPVVEPYKSFGMWWPDLSVESLGEDLDPLQRSELYHCHAFTKVIADLALIQTSLVKKVDVLRIAEQLYAAYQSGIPSGRARQALEVALDDKFNIESMTKAADLKNRDLRRLIGLTSSPVAGERAMVTIRLRRLRQRAPATLTYVSDQIGRFYFAKASELNAAGILSGRPEFGDLAENKRLRVVDLPSLPDKATRQLAVNSILASAWETVRNNWREALAKDPEQDKRVPTFIVVDEAHNLLPAEPSGPSEEALRDQFRSIAAEGRKYGLFLIIATQRPDKLDRMVLSECENKVLMKLDSESILSVTKALMGLDGIPHRELERCLEFRVGRGILAGKWASNSYQTFFCAARRTIEGGRNLKQSVWATPASAV